MPTDTKRKQFKGIFFIKIATDEGRAFDIFCKSERNGQGPEFPEFPDQKF